MITPMNILTSYNNMYESSALTVSFDCIFMMTIGLDWISKRHSLHAVELSQRSDKPCANCVGPSRPPQWVPDYRFWTNRPCGPAASLLIKAGDVETNPGLDL